MALLAILTMWLVFAQPVLCAQTLREGLALCGGSLLLSLFPFLIVSPLLMESRVGEKLGILFWPVTKLIGIRSPAAGGVLLIGALGGFAPAAVATSATVYSGELSKEEAAALLPGCICSGPSFVVLTVGQQLLGNRNVGVRLYVAQLLAGYLTAALLNRISGGNSTGARKKQEEMKEQDPAALIHLDAIVAQAAVNYLKLCGAVLYFRLLAAGCSRYLPQRWAVLPAMLLEVCSGCDLAARTGIWASGLCCAALSIQGLSVLMQVRTICPREVSFRPLLMGRLLHLPLSLAFFYLGLPEQAAEACSTLCGRVVTMRRVPVDCALLVFFVCCFVACELCNAAEGLQKIEK